MKIFSNSRLSCFEKCPCQFKLKYIDEVPVPDPFQSIEQYLGLRTHEALEKLYDNLISSHTISRDQLLSFFDDQWEHHLGPHVRMIKKGLDFQDYKRAGRSAIAHYYQRNHPFTSSKTLSTEMELLFDLGEYQIKGFIDRLAVNENGHYEIHDYKTSSRLPSKKSLHDDRQLALYQMGIQDYFKKELETDLIWHYLLFDQSFTLRKTQKELQEVKQQTLELIHNITKEEYFAPRESPLCNWCEYFPLCPAKQHGIKTRTLPIKEFYEDQGAFLLYRYETLQQRIKSHEDSLTSMQSEMQHLQKDIEQYANAHDFSVLYGASTSLSIQKRKCIRFPQNKPELHEDLKNWLIEHHHWEALSSLDIRKIKQYLLSDQADPEVKRKLMEHAECYELCDFSIQNTQEERNPFEDI